MLGSGGRLAVQLALLSQGRASPSQHVYDLVHMSSLRFSHALSQEVRGRQDVVLSRKSMRCFSNDSGLDVNNPMAHRGRGDVNLQGLISADSFSTDSDLGGSTTEPFVQLCGDRHNDLPFVQLCGDRHNDLRCCTVDPVAMELGGLFHGRIRGESLEPAPDPSPSSVLQHEIVETGRAVRRRYAFVGTATATTPTAIDLPPGSSDGFEATQAEFQGRKACSTRCSCCIALCCKVIIDIAALDGNYPSFARSELGSSPTEPFVQLCGDRHNDLRCCTVDPVAMELGGLFHGRIRGESLEPAPDPSPSSVLQHEIVETVSSVRREYACVATASATTPTAIDLPPGSSDSFEATEAEFQGRKECSTRCSCCIALCCKVIIDMVALDGNFTYRATKALVAHGTSLLTLEGLLQYSTVLKGATNPVTPPEYF